MLYTKLYCRCSLYYNTIFLWTMTLTTVIRSENPTTHWCSNVRVYKWMSCLFLLTLFSSVNYNVVYSTLFGCWHFTSLESKQSLYSSVHTAHAHTHICMYIKYVYIIYFWFTTMSIYNLVVRMEPHYK